jgi:hypothetical protein
MKHDTIVKSSIYLFDGVGMLKNIFLAGALLAPVLAYAGSPSTELSVQIVPAASPTPPPTSPTPPPSSGIACDIGPNYTGSIPAPAQAAGFTHCAANYDFTSAQFANVSSWLQCPDNGSAGALWYVVDTGNGVKAPCSDISMLNDGGTQVLDLTFTPADFNNAVTYIDIQTQSNSNEPNTNGTAFPNGALIETIERVPQSSLNSVSADNGALINDIWFYGTNNQYANENLMEWDFQEMYSPNTSNASAGVGEHCVNNFNCASFGGDNDGAIPGFNYTNYYTYWTRITQDTSGNFGFCQYLNGTAVQSPCVTGTYVDGSSDTSLNQKNNLVIWDGAQKPGQQCGSTPCSTPSGNVDLYVRRVTIWTCSNWQTTTNGCAGTVLPNP